MDEGDPGGRMADVFTVLAKDHDEVKGILTELEKGPTGVTGASENQLALRKKITEVLIIEESRHEALEEMYFWPVVRDHLPDGDTLADEATGQEQEAKEVLARLDKLEASDRSSRSCSVRSSGRPGSTSSSRRRRCGRGCARCCPPRRRPSWAAQDRRRQEDRADPAAPAHAPRRRACLRQPGPPSPRRTRRATR